MLTLRVNPKWSRTAWRSLRSLLVGASTTTPAAGQPPLSAKDFVGAAVVDITDTLSLRQRHGAPRVATRQGPASRLTWQYPGFAVEILPGGRIGCLVLSDSSVSTPRGLHVGMNTGEFWRRYPGTIDFGYGSLTTLWTEILSGTDSTPPRVLERGSISAQYEPWRHGAGEGVIRQIRMCRR